MKIASFEFVDATGMDYANLDLRFATVDNPLEAYGTNDIVSLAMRRCIHCGKEYPVGTQSCPECEANFGARASTGWKHPDDLAPRPKSRAKLGTLGGLLIFGGVVVLRQIGTTDAYYRRMGEEGGTSWATVLAWLMILAGGGLVLAELAKRFDGK